MRPVINLKRLNHVVETPQFKMEEIHTLRDLLRQGDWMVKADLILHHSHPPGPPEILEVYGGWDLPVCLPTIWPVLCPLNIYQADEAINDPTVCSLGASG